MGTDVPFEVIGEISSPSGTHASALFAGLVKRCGDTGQRTINSELH
jgi:hypothetical protein